MCQPALCVPGRHMVVGKRVPLPAPSVLGTSQATGCLLLSTWMPASRSSSRMGSNSISLNKIFEGSLCVPCQCGGHEMVQGGLGNTAFQQKESWGMQPVCSYVSSQGSWPRRGPAQVMPGSHSGVALASSPWLHCMLKGWIYKCCGAVPGVRCQAAGPHSFHRPSSVACGVRGWDPGLDLVVQAFHVVLPECSTKFLKEVLLLGSLQSQALGTK